MFTTFFYLLRRYNVPYTTMILCPFLQFRVNITKAKSLVRHKKFQKGCHFFYIFLAIYTATLAGDNVIPALADQ